MRISRPTRLACLAVTALAVVLAGAPSLDAADPFVAGQPSTRSLTLPAAEGQRAITRAAELSTALGLPGVHRRAERLEDRFDHLVYDEVVATDAAGREVAVTRFAPDGRVVMALVLGWQPRAGGALGREAIAGRGADLARAAGLTVAGRPVVSRSAGAGGWSVAWPRVLDGVRVVGDGVRISLWPDGSLHGLTGRERPLAAAPARRLSAGAAKKLAATIVADRFGSEARRLRPVAAELAWVAPNDTWSPNLPDAPAPTLRLAWLVRFEARGPLAERVRFVEYWLDAGSGELIGGDLAE